MKTGGDVQCEEDAVIKKGDAAKAKSSVDEAVGSGVGTVSWLVKERGAEVSTKGGGMRRDEDVVSERRREGDRPREREKWSGRLEGLTGKSGVDEAVWAAVRRVVEKKMGIQDPGEDVRRDEDVVLGRKGEGDRLRDTEEVGQQGVEDKGTKKRDEERSKVRDGQETSEMLGSLTKKGGQRCPQHIKMSLQVAKKELIKERPCKSSTKNSRNCVNISSVQRSVEWKCRGYMPTIKRRSASSGSLLSEDTVNGNRDRGRADSGTKGPLTSLMKVGKGVRSVRAQQNPWRRCRRTAGEEVGKHQEVSRGSHDL